jgi:hypothetical protein
VLNHLRSSFKHYTSKNRNKEIGWQTSIYSCIQTELSRKNIILHIFIRDDFVREFLNWRYRTQTFSCDNRK